MKLLLFSSWFLVWMIAGSCTQNKIKISTDFDHGSLGAIDEIAPGYFKGSTKHWLKRDNIGDQYYWFYFRADGVKDQSIHVELNDLIGVYRGNTHLVYTDYTQPVFSYDQNTWQRIENVSYDSATHTFVFSQQFEAEPAWIAYAHPYSHRRLLNFLDLINDHPHVQLQTVSRTRENRSIDLLTITDPDSDKEDKKTVLIIALQHAGEDAGAYLVEGLIQFLLSDDPGALYAKQHFIYHIVPMMNPDGIYNGITRYNQNLEDLNNIWMNESLKQPEVEGIKEWQKELTAQDQGIDLFLDVHNHSQFHTYHVLITQDEHLDGLVDHWKAYWPIRSWHSEFEGSSCAYFYDAGIPSGTIELSQSFVEEDEYLTIEDYHQYGRGTVLGITDYFKDSQ